MAKKKIKSYKEACKALNQDTTFSEFPALSDREIKAAIAHYKLVIIARALNEGWKPDWTDSNQQKWWPWFIFQDGRFVFGCTARGSAPSPLGSRLCFRTREIAEYAGKTFIDLYNDYYLIE